MSTHKSQAGGPQSSRTRWRQKLKHAQAYASHSFFGAHKMALVHEREMLQLLWFANGFCWLGNCESVSILHIDMIF